MQNCELIQAKNKLIVDISDAKLSNDPSNMLVTYSLGSCIGVTFYDSATNTGAMLHYQLPTASLDPERAKRSPFMFADTGIEMIVNKLKSIGVNIKQLKIKVAGGANMQTGPQGFDIGKRNYLAVRKILWQHGMFMDGEDVGGGAPRNLYLDLADGTVRMRSGKIEKAL
ncbi:MAG: hypothetical protein A2Y12_11750 [Planctomycetes bacterium GWF2_42_9]|nr:MAG: hypothetical protein A2Y12_11750 [Planctomycetes bacterium GWF2_42_9]